MWTPWGESQWEKDLAPGILDVGTAGHGGIHLNPERNAQIPVYMRNPSGWYEEDVEWAIPAIVFPNAFRRYSGIKEWTPRTKPIRIAIDTLRNWFPEHYERWFQEMIPIGQSHKKDEKEFLRKHKNDYIGLSAWGAWHQDVPEGFVAIFAGRGGRLTTGGYPKDTAYFLVPEMEYAAATEHGFVVDPTRHEEIPPIK